MEVDYDGDGEADETADADADGDGHLAQAEVFSHTYESAGLFTPRVRVFDDHGASSGWVGSTNPLDWEVRVVNRVPLVAYFFWSPSGHPDGAPETEFTFDVEACDPDGGWALLLVGLVDECTAEFGAVDRGGRITDVEVDYSGDGVGDATVSVSDGDGVMERGEVSFTHVYGEAVNVTPRVRVRDNSGEWSPWTGSTHIGDTTVLTNRPPRVASFEFSPWGDPDGAPGVTRFGFEVEACDPDGDWYVLLGDCLADPFGADLGGTLDRVEVDYDGDGEADETADADDDNGHLDLHEVSLTHRYPGAGSYTPRIRVRDDAGEWSAWQAATGHGATLEVADSAPTATMNWWSPCHNVLSVCAPGGPDAPAGTAVTLNATVGHPDASFGARIDRVEWDFDDGTSHDVDAVDVGPGATVASQGHTYRVAGHFQPRVRFRDDDGDWSAWDAFDFAFVPETLDVYTDFVRPEMVAWEPATGALPGVGVDEVRMGGRVTLDAKAHVCRVLCIGDFWTPTSTERFDVEWRLNGPGATTSKITSFDLRGQGAFDLSASFGEGYAEAGGYVPAVRFCDDAETAANCSNWDTYDVVGVPPLLDVYGPKAEMGWWRPCEGSPSSPVCIESSVFGGNDGTVFDEFTLSAKYHDPDGVTLDTLEWDFDGDGSVDETQAVPRTTTRTPSGAPGASVRHRYANAGRYTPRVRAVSAGGDRGAWDCWEDCVTRSLDVAPPRVSLVSDCWEPDSADLLGVCGGGRDDVGVQDAVTFKAAMHNCAGPVCWGNYFTPSTDKVDLVVRTNGSPHGGAEQRTTVDLADFGTNTWRGAGIGVAGAYDEAGSYYPELRLCDVGSTANCTDWDRYNPWLSPFHVPLDVAGPETWMRHWYRCPLPTGMRDGKLPNGHGIPEGMSDFPTTCLESIPVVDTRMNVRFTAYGEYGGRPVEAFEWDWDGDGDVDRTTPVGASTPTVEDNRILDVDVHDVLEVDVSFQNRPWRVAQEIVNFPTPGSYRPRVRAVAENGGRGEWDANGDFLCFLGCELLVAEALPRIVLLDPSQAPMVHPGAPANFYAQVQSTDASRVDTIEWRLRNKARGTVVWEKTQAVRASDGFQAPWNGECLASAADDLCGTVVYSPELPDEGIFEVPSAENLFLEAFERYVVGGRSYPRLFLEARAGTEDGKWSGWFRYGQPPPEEGLDPLDPGGDYTLWAEKGESLRVVPHTNLCDTWGAKAPVTLNDDFTVDLALGESLEDYSDAATNPLAIPQIPCKRSLVPAVGGDSVRNDHRWWERFEFDGPVEWMSVQFAAEADPEGDGIPNVYRSPWSDAGGVGATSSGRDEGATPTALFGPLGYYARDDADCPQRAATSGCGQLPGDRMYPATLTAAFNTAEVPGLDADVDTRFLHLWARICVRAAAEDEVLCHDRLRSTMDVEALRVDMRPKLESWTSNRPHGIVGLLVDGTEKIGLSAVDPTMRGWAGVDPAKQAVRDVPSPRQLLGGVAGDPAAAQKVLARLVQYYDPHRCDPDRVEAFPLYWSCPVPADNALDVVALLDVMRTLALEDDVLCAAAEDWCGLLRDYMEERLCPWLATMDDVLTHVLPAVVTLLKVGFAVLSYVSPFSKWVDVAVTAAIGYVMDVVLSPGVLPSRDTLWAVAFNAASVGVNKRLAAGASSATALKAGAAAAKPRLLRVPNMRGLATQAELDKTTMGLGRLLAPLTEGCGSLRGTSSDVSELADDTVGAALVLSAVDRILPKLGMNPHDLWRTEIGRIPDAVLDVARRAVALPGSDTAGRAVQLVFDEIDDHALDVSLLVSEDVPRWRGDLDAALAQDDAGLRAALVPLVGDLQGGLVQVEAFDDVLGRAERIAGCHTECLRSDVGAIEAGLATMSAAHLRAAAERVRDVLTAVAEIGGEIEPLVQLYLAGVAYDGTAGRGYTFSAAGPDVGDALGGPGSPRVADYEWDLDGDCPRRDQGDPVAVGSNCVDVAAGREFTHVFDRLVDGDQPAVRYTYADPSNPLSNADGDVSMGDRQFNGLSDMVVTCPRPSFSWPFGDGRDAAPEAGQILDCYSQTMRTAHVAPQARMGWWAPCVEFPLLGCSGVAGDDARVGEPVTFRASYVEPDGARGAKVTEVQFDPGCPGCAVESIPVDDDDDRGTLTPSHTYDAPGRYVPRVRVKSEVADASGTTSVKWSGWDTLVSPLCGLDDYECRLDVGDGTARPTATMGWWTPCNNLGVFDLCVPGAPDGQPATTFTFTADVTAPPGAVLATVDWDFDGDGTVDSVEPVAPGSPSSLRADAEHAFGAEGTWVPRVRATTAGGATGDWQPLYWLGGLWPQPVELDAAAVPVAATMQWWSPCHEGPVGDVLAALLPAGARPDMEVGCAPGSPDGESATEFTFTADVSAASGVAVVRWDLEGDGFGDGSLSGADPDNDPGDGDDVTQALAGTPVSHRASTARAYGEAGTWRPKVQAESVAGDRSGWEPRRFLGIDELPLEVDLDTVAPTGDVRLYAWEPCADPVTVAGNGAGIDGVDCVPVDVDGGPGTEFTFTAQLPSPLAGDALEWDFDGDADADATTGATILAAQGGWARESHAYSVEFAAGRTSFEPAVRLVRSGDPGPWVAHLSGGDVDTLDVVDLAARMHAFSPCFGVPVPFLGSVGCFFGAPDGDRQETFAFTADVYAAGGVAAVEWDFDGDGGTDTAASVAADPVTGASPQRLDGVEARHVFGAFGAFRPGVRVVDVDGHASAWDAYDIGGVTVVLDTDDPTRLSGWAPCAPSSVPGADCDLTPASIDGGASEPFTVTADLHAEAGIQRVEWDFDGDCAVAASEPACVDDSEEIAGVPPELVGHISPPHVFGAAVSVKPQARVIDSHGVAGAWKRRTALGGLVEPTLDTSLAWARMGWFDPCHDVEIAQVGQCLPGGPDGTTSQEFTFTATAYVDPLRNGVGAIEWDLAGDGFDADTPGPDDFRDEVQGPASPGPVSVTRTTEFTYDEAGSYAPKVRAVSNEPPGTATGWAAAPDTVDVVSGATTMNWWTPCFTRFGVCAPGGPDGGPSDVFTFSADVAADAGVAAVRWDFDGDGAYNEAAGDTTTTVPGLPRVAHDVQATHTYGVEGSWAPRVAVVGADGAVGGWAHLAMRDSLGLFDVPVSLDTRAGVVELTGWTPCHEVAAGVCGPGGADGTPANEFRFEARVEGEGGVQEVRWAFPSQGVAPQTADVVTAVAPVGQDTYPTTAEVSQTRTFPEPGTYVPHVQVVTGAGDVSAWTPKTTLGVTTTLSVAGNAAEMRWWSPCFELPLVGLCASGAPDGEAEEPFTLRAEVYAHAGIKRVEWDVDGDGVAEATLHDERDGTETHLPEVSAEHTYGVAGSWQPQVRVVDTADEPSPWAKLRVGPVAVDLDTTAHRVSLVGWTPCYTTLGVCAPGAPDGTPGSEFTFRADVGSDAGVVAVEWDFDGDGRPDETTAVGPVGGEAPRTVTGVEARHTYGAEVSVTPAVRVRDGLGRLSDWEPRRFAGLLPLVLDTQAGVAALSWRPCVSLVDVCLPGEPDGTPETEFEFSAQVSAEAGVATIEWDFEGDGTAERVTPVAAGQREVAASEGYAFGAAGSFRPRVRGVDVNGFATAWAEQTVAGVPVTLETAAQGTTMRWWSPCHGVLGQCTSGSPDGAVGAEFTFTVDARAATDVVAVVFDPLGDTEPGGGDADDVRVDLPVPAKTVPGVSAAYAYTSPGAYHPRARAVTSDGSGGETAGAWATVAVAGVPVDLDVVATRARMDWWTPCHRTLGLCTPGAPDGGASTQFNFHADVTAVDGLAEVWWDLRGDGFEREHLADDDQVTAVSGAPVAERVTSLPFAYGTSGAWRPRVRAATVGGALSGWDDLGVDLDTTSRTATMGWWSPCHETLGVCAVGGPDGEADTEFRFSADVQADAGVAGVQWDFDGDGFDPAGGHDVEVAYDGTRTSIAGVTASHVYGTGGTFQPGVRTVDAGGAVSAWARVTVPFGPLSVPVDLDVTGTAGEMHWWSPCHEPVPLLGCGPGAPDGDADTEFTFTADVAHENGVGSVDWDFDGDGVADVTEAVEPVEGAAPSRVAGVNATHVYGGEGSWRPQVRAVDPQGAPGPWVAKDVLGVPVDLDTISVLAEMQWWDPCRRDVVFGSLCVPGVPDGDPGSEFNFTAEVFAADGIERVEWDLRGDGFGDEDPDPDDGDDFTDDHYGGYETRPSRDTASVSYSYGVAGSWQPLVRVVDVGGDTSGWGRKAVAGVPVSLDTTPGITLSWAPCVNLAGFCSVGAPDGEPGTEFTFTVDARSEEPVAKVLWDFDGDRVADAETAVEPPAATVAGVRVTHTYAAARVYRPQAKTLGVNGGELADWTPQLAGGVWPLDLDVAVADNVMGWWSPCHETAGECAPGAPDGAPGTAFRFTADVSAAGGVRAVEWDFDGDNGVDAVTDVAPDPGTGEYPVLVAGAQVTHTYDDEVSVQPQVRAVDAATGEPNAWARLRIGGVAVDLDTVSVLRAALDFTPRAGGDVGDDGDVGTLFTFDASGSRVDQGRVVSEYRWDFDGDGTVDRVTSGATTEMTYGDAFPEHPSGFGEGAWPATVTVVDDRGATHTDGAKDRVTGLLDVDVDVGPPSGGACGDPAADADGDGVPCGFDLVDGDTVPYRERLARVWTERPVVLTNESLDGAFADLNLQRRALWSLEYWSGRHVFRNVDAMSAGLAKGDTVFSLWVSGAVASAANAAYVRGIGLCAAESASSLFGFVFAFCQYEMAVVDGAVSDRYRIRTTTFAGRTVGYDGVAVPGVSPNVNVEVG